MRSSDELLLVFICGKVHLKKVKLIAGKDGAENGKRRNGQYQALFSGDICFY